MRKFEIVNLIESLRTIMEHNTEHYQSDFDYDIAKLQNAAGDSRGSRHFLWLCRGFGTWCFEERDVYIRNTHAFSTWSYYIDSSENVKAFAVEIKAVEGKNIIGDLYELDYKAYVEDVRKNSFSPHAVQVVFKHPDECNGYIRKFDIDEYNNNWYSIDQRYGEIESLRYEVPDDWLLQEVLRMVRNTRAENSIPSNFDEYIAAMVKERFHSYGYTHDDMVFTTPKDAYDAFEHKIPVYALKKDNTRKLITCTDEISYHIFHKGIFGMSRDMKNLLDYLVAAPAMKASLFTDDELKQILSLALEAGKSNDLNRTELKILDSLIYKLEKVLPPPYTRVDEQEQQLESDMEAYG